MLFKKRGQSTFYCFSPLVMIVTFAIEVGLMAYTLFRYKLNPITRLAAALLFCLATFQFAEFMICEGSAESAETWSRIGFVAITLLPPLGLHLTHQIAGLKSRLLVPAAYATAAVFIVFFLLVPGAFSGPVCLGNYVIFEVASGWNLLYGAYYYSLLVATLWVIAKSTKSGATKRVRRALYGLALGYAAFLVPTFLINVIEPDTLDGVPSIMCGFAITVALIITFVVVPATAHKRI
jgi:hypothetical protein